MKRGTRSLEVINSSSISRVNRGGGAPRPVFMHSLWGLIGLPRGGPFDAAQGKSEWSVPEKARRVKEAGFEGIECPVDLFRQGPVREALDAHGLRLALANRFMGPEDFKAIAALAREARADYVFGRCGHAFLDDAEAAALVREGLAIMAAAGVPFFVETHRRTLTENPWRTLRLVERVPEVRFTVDLSHWIVAGTLSAETPEAVIGRLGPVLERTGTIQARVSNGEQVQIDAGDGSPAPARFMVALWTEAMRRWRRQAGPGGVLPFASELGPPPYSITDASGRELSDRWEQSLVMKRLGEEAWGGK
jgi:sugar phosphate isomerase/epimerase